MSSHGTHLGIRDKIKIYALPKAICNRPLYFAQKIGFGLSSLYINFHKWLTFNECGEGPASGRPSRRPDDVQPSPPHYTAMLATWVLWIKCFLCAARSLYFCITCIC